MKENLCDNDVLIHFDFSENYTCAHQDEVQTAHWNQSQVSIFTVAVYKSAASPELRALITNSTDHSKRTVCVYLDYLLKVQLVSYKQL